MWTKIQRFLRNPTKLKKLSQNRATKSWIGIVLVLCLIYFLTSDGDFSFFLTMASTLQMLAFIPICIQAKINPKGLSFYTFIFYALIHSSRLSSILVFEQYLPYDSSGDWFYQLVEIICLVLSCFIGF